MTVDLSRVPPFPLEHLSQTSSPPATPISGFVALVENSSTLIFPEFGDSRVDFRIQTRYRTNRPTRFVLKFSLWSGRGVQGYPWIYAQLDGRRLPARVQGKPFWINDRRCFIVDLGVEIPEGRYFDLVTQSLFVDEASRFKHFLTHRVDDCSELKKVRVAVAFKSPPGTVMFGHLPFEASQPKQILQLQPTERFGYVAFEQVIEGDICSGFYSVYW